MKNDNSKVMGLKGGQTVGGTEVVWQDPSDSANNRQEWKRSLPDKDGCFTLENVASNKLLHSKEPNKFTNGDVVPGPVTTPSPPATEKPPPDCNVKIKHIFLLSLTLFHLEGGLFDPLHHEFVRCIYRTRTRFTKIHDFVPFSICQDPVKLFLTLFFENLKFLTSKFFAFPLAMSKK